MTLLRIDASILGPQSASAELADLVLAEWSAERPDEPVVRRHLADDPIPASAWALANAALFTPAEQRTQAQQEALDLATALVQELRDADAVVLAFPLYNYGVSQHVRAWIDMIMVARGGDDKILAGKPIVLVTTRGGGYAPGSPREGWDNNTNYLRQIIGELWGADLVVVEREWTPARVKPELAPFVELGDELKRAAHEAAAVAGKALATR
jgi:FMN-dependent NADH-azoreductase